MVLQFFRPSKSAATPTSRKGKEVKMFDDVDDGDESDGPPPLEDMSDDEGVALANGGRRMIEVGWRRGVALHHAMASGNIDATPRENIDVTLRRKETEHDRRAPKQKVAKARAKPSSDAASLLSADTSSSLNISSATNAILKSRTVIRSARLIRGSPKRTPEKAIARPELLAPEAELLEVTQLIAERLAKERDIEVRVLAANEAPYEFILNIPNRFIR